MRPRTTTNSRRLAALALFVVPRRRFAAALLFACALCDGGASAQVATRLDGIAAVVGANAPGAGAEVILLSDVELQARLSLAAVAADPGQLETLPNSLLRATLSQLIGEHLIAREARRVQASTPEPSAVARERQRLIAGAGGGARVRGLLQALSAGEDELDAIVRRRALVGAFLSANLEGVTVVTESEVDRALAAAQDAPGAEGAQPLRSQLRARLSREALDRTIERWVNVLRARTPVRVYVQY